MKAATTFLVTGLLLAAGAAFGADDPAPVPESSQPLQTASAELPDDEPLLTPVGDCEADGDLAFGNPEPTPTAQTCGSCSSSNCQGANIGQQCWLGPGGHGWGHCDIFSGGYLCPTGGWECQCGSGPLP